MLNLLSEAKPELVDFDALVRFSLTVTDLNVPKSTTCSANLPQLIQFVQIVVAVGFIVLVTRLHY